MRLVLAAAAAAALALAAPAAAQQMIDVETERSVAEAADALVAAIEGAGARVMARVDHQANAESVGLELRPTTKLIFGNPNVGTPIMMDDQRAAILLPQMVLVWEDEGGQVRLSYLDPDAAFGDLDLDDGRLDQVKGALANLTAAAAG